MTPCAELASIGLRSERKKEPAWNMLAEIISIGDELVTGQRLDTNSQWLSQRLGDLGVRVGYHTTIGDSLDENLHALRAAIERADVVVSTGGLGPTADDLTREAMAAAVGVELNLDAAALEHIRSLFARTGREMPERNRLQAYFPAGARSIFNPRGTAPGIDLVARRGRGGECRLFALPGVPAEMFEMFAGHVAAALMEMQPERKVICHRRVKCFGAGESQIEQMLPDLIRRGRDPLVGITVSAATITLRVTAEGDSPASCAERMRPTLDTIRRSLGNLVFGEEDDELEDAVVRLLRERGETLAVVEAGGEGLLAGSLMRASQRNPQAGEVFLGGLTLSRAAVATMLGHEATESGDGDVFASAIARACRLRFGADYALAIGFFPSPGEATTPAEYHYALAGPETILSRRRAGESSRDLATAGRQASDESLATPSRTAGAGITIGAW